MAAEQNPRGTERQSRLIEAVADVLLDEDRGDFGAKPNRHFVAGVIAAAVDTAQGEVVPREDAETLARAVSASLTHGERSPLEAALTVYLSKHPWSDL